MTCPHCEVHDFLVDRVHSVTIAHPPHLKLITSMPIMNDKESAVALAIVAIAHKLLIPTWYILTRHKADRHAIPEKVVGAFLQAAYSDLGAKNLSNGEVPLEFVRLNLDALALGKELQTVKHSAKAFILPQSSQPGAAPVPAPKGRGQLQNTRAAQQARAAAAARTRAEREPARAEQIARTGKPRKTRSDTGLRRGARPLYSQQALFRPAAPPPLSRRAGRE